MSSATSMGYGDAIRNVVRIPIGRPAATIPARTGIELQLQKGVMNPKTAAEIIPRMPFFPPREFCRDSSERYSIESPMRNVEPRNRGMISAIMKRKYLPVSYMLESNISPFHIWAHSYILISNI